MRQALAYKILDIILLISLRIGPEQTRIEMTHILRVFFDGFNQVKSTLQSPATNQSLQSPRGVTETTPSSATRARSAFKARTSIVSFDQTGGTRRFVPPTSNSTDLNSSVSNDNASNDDSFDEYLKFSYDQSTNEIIGSSLRVLGSKSPPRTSNFGLLNQQESINEGYYYIHNQ